MFYMRLLLILDSEGGAHRSQDKAGEQGSQPSSLPLPVSFCGTLIMRRFLSAWLFEKGTLGSSNFSSKQGEPLPLVTGYRRKGGRVEIWGSL